MQTKSVTGIFKDLQANRIERANEGKNVLVVRLTKNGNPSKLAGDTMRFEIEEQAAAYLTSFYKNNPGSTAKFITIK